MKFLFIIFTLTFLSCGQNHTKQKELELKERELALKEKEFALKDSQQKSPVADTTKKVETIATESSADVKVQAFLIYRSGKLSSFDILNDKSKKDGLWNTIIGEGVAEDWSEKTKIIITGTAKNVTLLIKNGGMISVNKKNIDITDKEEFVIAKTGCDELKIKISSGDKVFYSGKIPFMCGE
jgi:hypothetical protein